MENIQGILKLLTILPIFIIGGEGAVQMTLVGCKTTIDLLGRWVIDNMIAMIKVKEIIRKVGILRNLAKNVLEGLPGSGRVDIRRIIGLLTDRTGGTLLQNMIETYAVERNTAVTSAGRRIRGKRMRSIRCIITEITLDLGYWFWNGIGRQFIGGTWRFHFCSPRKYFSFFLFFLFKLGEYDSPNS
jgi:hypothetical protein